MAVDTAEKRYSMINFADGDLMIFEVDGAVDLDDRQHLLGCYSGIAFNEPGAPAFKAAWVRQHTKIHGGGIS